MREGVCSVCVCVYVCVCVCVCVCKYVCVYVCHSFLNKMRLKTAESAQQKVHSRQQRVPVSHDTVFLMRWFLPL
jgi:hypothetical protein